MKLFKKKSFLKKIFFFELILIFSIVSSFVISVFVEEIMTSGSGTFPHPRFYRHLLANYSVLRHFLALPDSVFLPDKGKDKEVKPENNDRLTADILKLKSIEALLEEKKYSQVNHLLKSLKQPHGFLKEKIAKLSLKTLYFQQKYRDFIKQYDTVPIKNGIKDNLEIQLMWINCLNRTKEKVKALNLFKKLFLKNRLKPFGDFISTGTLNLFLQKLEYDDWFKKFKYLVGKNYFSEFLREKRYIKAPELHHLFYAEFYYKQKRYSDVQRHLSQVKHSKLLKHKETLLLKIELRRKNYNVFFTKLNGLKADIALYAEVLFDSASILLVHRELDLSLALFSKYIKLIETDPQLEKKKNYWKALWFSAWILYRKKDPLKTLQHFKKGIHSDSETYKIANIYWFHRMKKTGSSQLENYPFSYYYTKTKKSGEGSGHDSLKRFINLINGEQGPLFHRIIDDLKSLLKNRLIDESFDFIHWAKREKRLTNSERNTLKILESIFYLKKEDFYHAFVTFRRNFDCYQRLRLPIFLRSIYTPIKYNTIIDTYSKQYNLDRNLVLALIREESFFRPDIVSPARANGLMQLLYTTARKIAAKEGIRIKKWDLYTPRINIRLGTVHLKKLQDKYNGKLHLALAAYNAGEHRVDNWLQEFGNVPDDVFIELIPFTETRSYVKNVLRNYYYYRFYYGE